MDQGLTWFGRHPYISLPILALLFPLWPIWGGILGAVLGVQEWMDEAKLLWRQR